MSEVKQDKQPDLSAGFPATDLADGLVAGFTASAWQGTPPLAVQFTNTTRGTVLSQHWDFGDGGSSTERSPAHVFRLRRRVRTERDFDYYL